MGKQAQQTETPNAHSAGPWSVQQVGMADDGVNVECANGELILCVAGETWERYTDARQEAEANARLAAAAPELLEALELVADLASQEWQESDGVRRAAIDNFGERQWFIGNDVMAAARAAIAKAKVEAA